ncbi:MAG TPA: hypothetical protein VFO90_04290 [Terrimicrobiaceae bacterium]|nr:hypothetical protein [Terrimicrobiaceae bacterium]
MKHYKDFLMDLIEATGDRKVPREECLSFPHLQTFCGLPGRGHL